MRPVFLIRLIRRRVRRASGATVLGMGTASHKVFPDKPTLYQEVTDKIIAELKAGRVCGRPAADLLRRHPAEDLSAILEPGFV
jgi:hypothetical protein